MLDLFSPSFPNDNDCYLHVAAVSNRFDTVKSLETLLRSKQTEFIRLSREIVTLESKIKTERKLIEQITNGW